MAMVLDSETDLSFPYWTSIRRRFGPDSSFFATGNLERELLAKQVALDLTEDEKHQLLKMVDQDTREVFCPIVGCGARLTSLEDFENHYNAHHTASCSVCSRVYPTSRLLSIHVSEAHDSFFQAKVARGYAVASFLSLTLYIVVWKFLSFIVNLGFSISLCDFLSCSLLLSNCVKSYFLHELRDQM
ncbi:hypothetical protein SLEP1_g56963 [Rubroshorea leprosula]|uniref:C2H2-type domain-containing protein n=1 Tax=Rubroshorea leprosula TaxID=152421 RepID=A0AAV5MJZ7_9ROSI|nr:hypothetical protein SLEP1_g56963 [Rubroshorea leprosula]